MNKNFSTNKQMYLRLTACILIWQIYIQFMSVYAPLGTEWLSWHSQRIYNFSEYLNLNGYFSSYGFSIWSTCQDCSLKSELWTNKIYLSSSFFSFVYSVFCCFRVQHIFVFVNFGVFVVLSFRLFSFLLLL